jgi:hypothetical protein
MQLQCCLETKPIKKKGKKRHNQNLTRGDGIEDRGKIHCDLNKDEASGWVHVEVLFMFTFYVSFVWVCKLGIVTRSRCDSSRLFVCPLVSFLKQERS